MSLERIPQKRKEKNRTQTTASVDECKEGTCVECRKLARHPHQLLLHGRLYHAVCFTCPECGAVGKDTDGRKAGSTGTCRCRHAQVRCAGCMDRLSWRHAVTIGLDRYHAACARCRKCSMRIDPLNVQIFHGRPYCSETCVDWARYPRCTRCSKPIGAGVKAVIARGKYFHPDCFQCARCKRPLADIYYLRLDRPFCKDCKAFAATSRLPTSRRNKATFLARNRRNSHH